MALNDISLTAGMRSNLISLQNTTTLLDRTQTRLSTGKKVNTALDNPTNFFAAQAHTQRASDLTTRKDGMSEAIQAVRAANDGITGITALIEAAKGLTQSARSADRTGRDSLSTQFNLILNQITTLATDSGYKGKNFLKADSLQVLFNENGGSFLTIEGFSATASGLTLTTLTASTADVISSGIAGGSGIQIAQTAIHTASLNTTLTVGKVDAFTGFNMLGTTFSATQLASGGATALTGNLAATGVGQLAGFSGDTSGVFLNIAGNAFMNAAGTTYSGLNASAGINSGGYTITAVYANGMLLTSGTHYLTTSGEGTTAGFSGGMYFQVSSGQGSGIVSGLLASGKDTSAIAFTFDIQIVSHASGSSAAAPTNITIYDLATGDLGSGLSVTGLDGSTIANLAGSGNSGTAIYVSGILANPNTYSISGNYLIFVTSGAPSTVTGAIQYNYNTGFSLTSGQNVTQRLAFTGMTLGTGQSITEVKINGVVTTDYTLSGVTAGDANVIVFTSGNQPGVGVALTYTVTTSGASGSWTLDAGIDDSVDQLDAALATLRTNVAALGSNLSVVSIRQDFTSNLVNDLLKGADNLTLADTNEEGANMLMLQTRQQLSTTSLKMASDAAQAVLRLF